MAKLHEHQGKALLRAAGIAVPRGRVARTAAEARAAAEELGGAGVVKVQAWVTGRAAAGGIALAATPAEAEAHAARMLAMTFGRFPVTEVLVEERLAIVREVFLSLAIDERERAPVLLLAAAGGSGVESRAAEAKRVPCHVARGPDRAALASAAAGLGLSAELARGVERAAEAVFGLARRHEARSVEINPLAVTAEGALVAADCRVTIDDAAAGRHPELGIEIARELDHPPTALERAAYRVEQEDHRGTFFFAQMNAAPAAGSRGLLGFHGAGGGGSMMSMDAATAEGFTVANFCDTSGNPSAAKVYRAARIILSQPGLVGYFGSGSGVANQEQFWSAYGLAKAFWELELSIPAVVRLGGNTEDRAVDVLGSACAGLPGRVEGYKKDDTPARVAGRLGELVREAGGAGGAVWVPRAPRRPAFASEGSGAFSFDVKGGRAYVDRSVWASRGAAIAARSGGVLRDEGGGPALAVTAAEALGRDGEMIACEVECRRDGIGGVFVALDVPGLDAKAGC